MLGKPIYKVKDKVEFDIVLDDKEGSNKITCVGKIIVVDAYGTFFNNDQPYYDIMVDDWNGTGQRMCIKHCAESGVRPYKGE